MDLFKDVINNINTGTDNLFEGSDKEAAEKTYEPYIVNRSMSHFADTILYASEMNIRHFLDKKMQYDYLFYSVRKRKRFTAWVKKAEVENLKIVKEYYGYSDRKAKEALSILNAEQIDYIRSRLEKGGLRKK